MTLVRLPTGVVDLRTRSFTPRAGDTISLTRREADLLEYLAERAFETVSRHDIAVEVWEQHPSTISRAVDLGVARLRQKIELDPTRPEALVTTRGVGYRLLVDGAAAVAAPPTPPPIQPMLQVGDRRVTLDTGVVTDPTGETRILRKRSLELLQLLAERTGEFVEARWLGRRMGLGSSDRGVNAVKTAVFRLRQALEADPANPTVILSRRGGGYQLAPTTEPPMLAASHILWAIADHVVETFGFPDCVVHVLRDGKLHQVAAAGPKSQGHHRLSAPRTLSLDEGIVGWCAKHRQIVVCSDTSRDPRYVRDGFEGQSELAVPILANGMLVGVLDAESDEVGGFDAHDIRVFTSLAQIASAATAELGRIAGTASAAAVH